MSRIELVNLRKEFGNDAAEFLAQVDEFNT